MARIVTFSDSFTSATQPFIEGVTQENYPIENNASGISLFSIDASEYKTAFVSFEIARGDILGSYIESGKMQLLFDGTNWNMVKNISINDEIIVDAITLPQHVVFSMQTSGTIGELIYSSGTMSGFYTGTFRISIVRMAIV